MRRVRALVDRVVGEYLQVDHVGRETAALEYAGGLLDGTGEHRNLVAPIGTQLDAEHHLVAAKVKAAQAHRPVDLELRPRLVAEHMAPEALDAGRFRYLLGNVGLLPV